MANVVTDSRIWKIRFILILHGRILFAMCSASSRTKSAVDIVENLTHLETFPKVLCHICSALFHLSLVVIVLSPFLGARGKTNPSATIPSTSFKGIACNSCSTKDRIISPLATYLSLFDAPFPGSPPSAGKLQCELKALLCFWRPDPRR